MPVGQVEVGVGVWAEGIHRWLRGKWGSVPEDFRAWGRDFVGLLGRS